MPHLGDDFINLSDLYVAYRKAKVDAFYEKDQCIAEAFCDYEANLQANLEALKERLQTNKPEWSEDAEFVGSHAYLPKTLHTKGKDVNKPGFFYSSDSDSPWISTRKKQRLNVEFRRIGVHPVGFHVVSALWIQKTGYLYDAVLKPNVYGSRLRGMSRSSNSSATPPARRALGSFQPYHHRYRLWLQKGFQAIRNALEAGHAIVAITADLRSFYHEASADYLLNESFLGTYGIVLDDNQRTFTLQLVNALATWARGVGAPDPFVGLPVGLSAPRVITNSLLCALDDFVLQELEPIYYGRYVDDIFLVLGNSRDMQSIEDVWDHIAARSASNKGSIVKIAKAHDVKNTPTSYV